MFLLPDYIPVDELSIGDTKQLSTSTFVSGITGDGFRISDDGADGVSMEIDNIMVRNTLRTHIFQKDVVKATNGILYVNPFISTWGAKCFIDLSLKKTCSS